MYSEDFNYELKNEIGHGVYGKVFLSKDKFNNDVVIKKFMKCDKVIHGSMSIREIDILRKMNLNVKISKFFVKLMDIIIDDDKDYETFSMVISKEEYSGEIFIQKIENRNPKLVYKLACDLFLGVSHMHGFDIIHRDIKPHNLLISRDDRGEFVLKICDFGLSMYNTHCSTPEYDVVSRNYRAPEIFYKITHYDCTSDIWSVGCTLYEFLFDKFLFDIDKADEKKIRNDVYKDKELDKLMIRNIVQHPYITVKKNDVKYYEKIGKNVNIPKNIEKNYGQYNSLVSELNSLNYDNADEINELCIIINKCLVFSCRERSDTIDILTNHFNKLKDYKDEYLSLIMDEKPGIFIKIKNIPLITNSGLNIFKDFINNMEDRLKKDINYRILFHAVDMFHRMANETSNVRYLVINCIHFFMKYFCTSTMPPSSSHFYKRLFSDEKDAEENVINFEKEVLTKFNGEVYRRTMFECIDDYKHKLSETDIRKLLNRLLDITEWNDGSYRSMYRKLYNEIIDKDYVFN